MHLVLRSRKIARNNTLPNTFTNTPVESKNNTMVSDSVVKHEIYTSTVNIPKFCGDPKIIDVDAWLILIDNHIANKGVADDIIKTEVLKQHINTESGEARHVIKPGSLESTEVI